MNADQLRQFMQWEVDLREAPGPKRLEAMGLAYSCTAAYVLAHGIEYEPQELPGGYPIMEPKLCFQNARILSMLHEELTYAEGYAFSILPVHHAFCVDAEGRVIDPTWPEPGEVYIGVPFTEPELKELRCDPGASALDDWRRGWPILQKKKQQKKEVRS